GERMIARIRRAYSTTTWPQGWGEAVRASDSVRFLTAAEAIEISEEIKAIIDRHQSRRDDPGSRPEGALPVQIAHYLFPMPEMAGLGGQESRYSDTQGNQEPSSPARTKE